MACAMLLGMPKSFLQVQVAFDVAPAVEWDITAYENLAWPDRRRARLADQLHPCDDELEVVCGTGIGTPRLAACACDVTALDAALVDDRLGRAARQAKWCLAGNHIRRTVR